MEVLRGLLRVANKSSLPGGQLEDRWVGEGGQGVERGSQWRMRGWRGEEVTERLVKERGVVEVRERKMRGEE